MFSIAFDKAGAVDVVQKYLQQKRWPLQQE